MSLRSSFGAKEKEAFRQICLLGPEARKLLQEKDSLQRERNCITEAFKQKGSDKEALKIRGNCIKDSLNRLDSLYQEIENKLSGYEALLPNLPDPGVPIGKDHWRRRNIIDQDLSYRDYCEAKRSTLHVLQHLMRESLPEYRCLECQREISLEEIQKHSDHPLVYLKDCVWCSTDIIQDEV